MKSKKITIGLISILLLSVFSATFILFASAKTTTLLPEYEAMRVGENFRSSDFSVDLKVDPNKKAPSGGSSGGVDPVDAIDVRLFAYADFSAGYYMFSYFYLYEAGDGEKAQIWVHYPLDWQEDDPRSNPVVTEEQISTLLYEFENHILPTDEGYFGESDELDGMNAAADSFFPSLELPADYWYDAEGRDIILVSNIRDDNYYYSDYPYYVAGFYSPSFEYYFDRNIISIDCYNWEDRIGPDVDRPYLYESLIAHEYQHLIHDDYFTPNSDATFMNEGCSMYAEVLCGYPTAWGDINSFLATPDNSLIEWGDQGDINILADYGSALLWATYLNDVVSPTFLQEYLQAGWDYNGVYAGGIDLLNFWLGQPKYDTDFETMFKAWQLANLMKTGYSSFDLNDREADDVRILELKEKWPTDVYGTDFGNTITILDFDTGVSGVGSYGTDYILLSKLQWQPKYASELHFDGEDVVDVPHWVYEDGSWYSTPGGAFSNLELFLDVDLVGDTMADPADLSILTMYNIEEFWDFGFVQIWDGFQWVTLDDGVYCTDEADPNVDLDIEANLPGLTGDSGGWITIVFDLTPYKGLDTQVRFLYMTDPVQNNPGWWIDTVTFKGVELDDEDLYTPPLPTTSFIVTVVRQDFWDGVYYYDPIDVFEVSGSNVFTLDLAVYLEPIDDIRKPDVLLVITPRLGVADYKFSVVKT